MYHVFVDFEMTCGFDTNLLTKAPIQEIIEIGAVKLDDQYKVINTFSMNVKLKYSKNLSKKCTTLTGITDSDLENAPDLDEALIIFEDWIGTDEVRIFSWSDSDKIQLQRECIAKGLYSTMPEIYCRWLDFQRIFMRVYGFERQIKLANAVELMGLDFDGRQHKAVYDAVNSAKLLMLMKDKERHAVKRELFSQIHDNRTVTSSIGDLFGDKLARLNFAS